MARVQKGSGGAAPPCRSTVGECAGATAPMQARCPTHAFAFEAPSFARRTEGSRRHRSPCARASRQTASCSTVMSVALVRQNASLPAFKPTVQTKRRCPA